MIETFTLEVSEAKLLPLIRISVPMGPVAGEKLLTAMGWEGLWEKPLLFLQLMSPALVISAADKMNAFILENMVKLIFNE